MKENSACCWSCCTDVQYTLPYIINLWLLGTGMTLNTTCSVEQVPGLSNVFVNKLFCSTLRSADGLAQCVQKIVQLRYTVFNHVNCAPAYFVHPNF
jgi:hypothetical protein